MDFRYAFRQLTRNPAFTIVALLALALGIGANSAIFTAFEAVLLRPLPYGNPDRLVIVWEEASFVGFAHNTPAVANYEDWRKQNTVFTDMAATRSRKANLTGDGPPEQLRGRAVTPNFFDVIGVQPAIGRPFTKEEDAAGAKVVLISDGLWHRRFGGDPTIVGKSIYMNGDKVQVIGVMPKRFFFPDFETEYWVPTYFAPKDLSNRNSHFLTVVARLKEGVTLQAAETQMNTVARRLQVQYPDSNKNLGAVVVPIRKDLAGDSRVGLWMLLIASALVLLIACTNLANLLLVKASGRRREIAVRLAIGASRMRILRQLMLESLMLSLSGGVLGLIIGRMSWVFLKHLLPPDMTGATFSMNPSIILFTFFVSLLAAVIFGLAPALHATQGSLADALKQSDRSGTGSSTNLLRDSFVVLQFTLALSLLIGAGLMIQTLWNLHRIDLGFRPDHLLTMTVQLPLQKYDTDEKLRLFYADVLAGVKRLPAVQKAGFTLNLPFTTNGNTSGYIVEGEPKVVGEMHDALYREVTNDYLQTIGATLIQGRLFDNRDSETSIPVIVVNEILAQRHWPNKNPIGKRLQFGDDVWRTVAGVVKTVHERDLTLEMKPAIYVPVSQVRTPTADYIVVRTSTDPMSLANAVRKEIWAVDPDQAVGIARPMQELVAMSTADRNKEMVLLSIFAALALGLACIGVYGVLMYAVSQRQREIGIRMALGANPATIMRMILDRGIKLSSFGVIAGTITALIWSRLLQSLLYDVKATAPLTYVATAGILFLVAVLASYLPGRRAARVNPLVALRDE
jgi:putative ABC transport system permease protein